MIKVAPPAKPCRAFALWFALLVLYFLLLPSAADTPNRGAGISASASHAVNIVSSDRHYAAALRR